MSELVSYHHRSPDPMVAGCQNTREEGTDGVVFNGVEPLVASFMFIGRQSIIEAVGELYGLTPAEVKSRLEPQGEPDAEYEQPIVKRGPGRPRKQVNGED